MKVKFMVYGFKSWLGPIGMQSVIDIIEGEVTQEALADITFTVAFSQSTATPATATVELAFSR